MNPSSRAPDGLRLPSRFLIVVLLLAAPWGLAEAEPAAGGPGPDLIQAMDAPGAAKSQPVPLATASPGATPGVAVASGADDGLAGGRGPSPGARVGVADMLVLNALHPAMARFDFQQRAFLRIPFSLAPAERDALFARLREEARSQEPAFQETLRQLASEEADIARRRGEVIDALRTGAGLKERLALEEELRRLQAAQVQVKEQQDEVRSRREWPEYTTASETRAILDGIEREVREVLGEVARREGVQVVLNANLPYPPPDPATARISPMARNRLAWLETDLYYSFLASSPPDTAVYDPVADGAAADEWVKLVRHPAAAPFFPVRPYPLVLQGGVDLTAKVLAALLERHQVDPRRARALVEAVGRLRRED